MKKLIIALLFCAGLNAQEFGKWSLEMSYGENLVTDQIGVSRTSSLVNLGTRYMLTPTFGLQTFGQFDVYRSSDYPDHLECEYRAYGVSARLEMFKRFFRKGRFTINGSLGIGGNYMWLNHPNHDKERTFQYTAAGSVLYGLGDRYKWGALKLEYRVLANTSQDRTLNGNFETTQNGINSYFQNLSMGFVVYLGTNSRKRPADFWKEKRRPKPECCEKEIVQPITVNPTQIIEKDNKPVEYVFFDYDKKVLKVQSRNAIYKVANYMKQNPQYKLKIEGWACASGTKEYNQRLSQDRAEIVYLTFVALGVDKERLSFEGKGIDYDYVTELSHQFPRRTELILYK